jgi:biopolymer transport protein ExbD
MARRRKKRRNQPEVELNLTAMLDLAFQLLAFFCLTFKPAPVEGQILLRLPPPQAILSAQNAVEKPGSDVNNKNPVQGVNTLTITVFADPKTGEIQSLGVGETQVPNIAALDGKLKTVFSDPGNPFDQVIIQVSDACRYDELMKIVDICTHQVLPDGQKLSKLSFVEIPSG